MKSNIMIIDLESQTTQTVTALQASVPFIAYAHMHGTGIDQYCMCFLYNIVYASFCLKI